MVGLTLRKDCGEKVCPEYHMCQPHDLQCYPCHSYCNETSHNFDSSICEQQCQDYLHDYVRHYVKDSNIRDMLQELESLKSWMIFMTLLVAVALVLMSVTLAFIWSREWKIRNSKNGGKDSYFKKKLSFFKFKDNAVSTVSETVDKPWTAATTMTMIAAQTMTDGPKTTADAAKAAGAGSSSAGSSSGGHRTSRTTVSSSSTSSTDKLPCEDATLVPEFTGYDNLGLCKVSPVLCGKPTPLKMYNAADGDLLHRYSP